MADADSVRFEYSPPKPAKKGTDPDLTMYLHY